MEYWIRLKGEKVGPLREWDVRDKIESGELTAEDLAWHDGLETWQPLSSVSVFASSFAQEEDFSEEIEMGILPPEGEDIAQMSTPPTQYWVRRAFAKVLDMSVYQLAFKLFIFGFGIPLNIGLMLIVWLIPFWLLEGIMMMRFGTTLGKWALGLRVEPLPGVRPLNFNRSVIRSAASWFLGMALGTEWCVLSMIVSYFSSKARGITTWDLIARTYITSSFAKPQLMHYFRYVGILFLSFATFATTITSHQPTRENVEAFISQYAPEIKELMETYQQQQAPTGESPSE